MGLFSVEATKAGACEEWAMCGAISVTVGAVLVFVCVDDTITSAAVTLAEAGASADAGPTFCVVEAGAVKKSPKSRSSVRPDSLSAADSRSWKSPELCNKGE